MPFFTLLVTRSCLSITSAMTFLCAGAAPFGVVKGSCAGGLSAAASLAGGFGIAPISFKRLKTEKLSVKFILLDDIF